LEEIGIDPAKLEWKPMPEATEEPSDEEEAPMILAKACVEALTLVSGA